MSPITLAGGCHCGAVRYRIAAPADRTTHCHCSMCRKTHGALFGSYSAFPRTAFVLERGEEALKDFESSPGVRRRFCRHCGSPLFFDYDGGEAIVDIAIGTIDDGVHPGHAPERTGHIHAASRAGWEPINLHGRQWPEDHDFA